MKSSKLHEYEYWANPGEKVTSNFSEKHYFASKRHSEAHRVCRQGAHGFCGLQNTLQGVKTLQL